MSVNPTIGEALVDADQITTLRATVTGPVLLPGEDGFTEECAGFNLLIAHTPAVVVGVTDTSDVQAAVRFAVEHDLPVAVMCTGHQLFNPAEDCVLITTSRMNSVHIDPENQMARVACGALTRDVVDHAATIGLAPLNGASPEVAITGYVLGGGHSPTMGRTYGWAADHVQALDVVTAEGTLHRVTGSCDAELFWALRGGKSNFGVVTALELDLFPVATYFGGGLYYDGAHTATVLHAYRQWIAQAPEELNSSVALLRLPPLPFVPEPLRGRLVVHVRVSYLGSPEDAERLVEPLRALVPPVIDTLAPMPYAQFASIHQDPSDQMPYQERTGLLRELTAEGVDALVQATGPDSSSGITIVELRHLGGALARPPKQPNAVGNRDAALTILGVALGSPDEIASAVAQTEELLMRMAPWSTGGRYLNFMSGADPVETAYSAETYQRLRTVKTAYDPRNVFRLNNHNILPLD